MAGRIDEGIREVECALQLAPLSLDVNQTLGWALYQARQYDNAINHLSAYLRSEPEFGTAHFALGLALEQKGMYQDAIAEHERAVELTKGSFLLVAVLGYTYGVAGKREKAGEVIQQLKLISERAYISPFALALVYVGLGDVDQALEWLEMAYKERSHFLVYLKSWPVFDSLRSDPRFQDLVRRVGLPS